jgi:ABC-type transport system involved in cytochrome bd biosynthesis fused ATPase/permease subunit
MRLKLGTSPQSLSWLIATIGSGTILFFHFYAGLATLILIAALILVTPSLPITEVGSHRKSLKDSQRKLAEELVLLKSHRLEGLIFGYAKKLGEGIESIREKYTNAEISLYKAITMRSLIAPLFLLLSLIVNISLITTTLESTSRNLLATAIPILLPLVIFDSVSRLLHREILQDDMSESPETR